MGYYKKDVIILLTHRIYVFLTLAHRHTCSGVVLQRPLYCLLKLTTKTASKLYYWLFFSEIHCFFRHNGPLMRKVFPCHSPRVFQSYIGKPCICYCQGRTCMLTTGALLHWMKKYFSYINLTLEIHIFMHFVTLMGTKWNVLTSCVSQFAHQTRLGEPTER